MAKKYPLRYVGPHAAVVVLLPESGREVTLQRGESLTLENKEHADSLLAADGLWEAEEDSDNRRPAEKKEGDE